MSNLVFGPGLIGSRIQGLALIAAVIPSHAGAQEGPTSAPSMARPADSDSPAICTDRPGKGTSACTVPHGAFQLEADVINWSRLNFQGSRSDTVLYANPTIKYGLTKSTDIEANIAPYETIRTRDATSISSVNGVGDLYLRMKQRLTSSAAMAQFALIPYIKVPTAKLGIGNRKLEGGLVATGVFTLSHEYSLTFTPEIDDLENADLQGHHAQLVAALSLAKPLSSKLTANAELWTAQNYDPSGTVRQYSVDGALAYAAARDLQFDAGVNVGLNGSTPGVQAYLGAAKRF
jgi:hypothetical protein